MNEISAYKYFLSISWNEVKFPKRGFHLSTLKIQAHLEKVGVSFLQGYHFAIAANRNLTSLLPQLDNIDPEYRGFAYEGAGMGLALLDCLTPWNNNRLQDFLNSSASAHIYMIHVGAGWAWARLHRNFERNLKALDPLLGWLALDGYGFHQGYFYWPKYIDKQQIPHRLSLEAQRVFDQGLGRSLWFVKGAEPDRIASTIQAFDSSRQADLWSGLGLACAYAGGVDESSLQRLKTLASPFLAHLAQGVAFAAKARLRAGNPSERTAIACEILCGLTPKQAAQITDLALENLPIKQSQPSYELWRQRIQANFSIYHPDTNPSLTKLTHSH